jgi:hypothetical protein
MSFCALRIVCERCHQAFVVGGGHKSELTSWRGLLVDCPGCGAEIQANSGEIVSLGTPKRDTLALPDDLPPAGRIRGRAHIRPGLAGDVTGK